jgi:ribosomal protein L16 Arg81 hydroxylase
METIPANQCYEREIMPVMSCRLQEGDWLYIPAGYWHQTQAHAESISLSVGLRPLTALDLYDSLRPQLLNDLLWRQRLPCLGSLAGDSTDFHADWPALRAMLASDLQQRLERMSVATLEELMDQRSE